MPACVLLGPPVQTRDFFSQLNIPSQTRLLHPTVFPLCTFGYALTRPAAHRLLTEIAAHEAEGGTMAFDVRVLEACRDLGMRCWSVAPELMRHLGSKSEIADVNAGNEDQAPSNGEVTLETTPDTMNIACGLRSSEAFVANDTEKLKYLQEVVGRQGRCLRDENRSHWR